MLSSKLRIIEAVNGKECATKISENLDNIEGLLQNAPSKEQNMFKIPKVMWFKGGL